jgi:hypothetical protein
VILNAAVLPHSQTSYKLYRVNATSAFPVIMAAQTYTYAWTISGSPYMSPMKNSLLVAMVLTNGSIKGLEYSKLSLSYVATMNLDRASLGVYIPIYDLFVYHTSIEYLVYDPSIANSSAHYLGSYSSPTSFPEQMKYLYTKDNLLFFTFYKDTPFFLRRTLNANLNAFATGPWVSPTQVAIPGIGYQCACFNNDHTVIYLMDNSGRMVSYVIA